MVSYKIMNELRKIQAEFLEQNPQGGDFNRVVGLLRSAGFFKGLTGIEQNEAVKSMIQPEYGKRIIIARDNTEYMGAEPEIVGVAVVSNSKLDTEHREQVVETLFVAPESRGKGLGGAILGKCVELAIDSGSTSVVFARSPGYWDPEATNFLVGHGFMSSPKDFLPGFPINQPETRQ